MASTARKYLATVKRPAYSKPVVLRFNAEDDRSAVERMYSLVAATKPSDIVEYDLMEELGGDRYRPVAAKVDLPKLPQLTLKDKETRMFDELKYISYKEVV